MAQRKFRGFPDKRIEEQLKDKSLTEATKMDLINELSLRYADRLLGETETAINNDIPHNSQQTIRQNDPSKHFVDVRSTLTHMLARGKVYKYIFGDAQLWRTLNIIVFSLFFAPWVIAGCDTEESGFEIIIFTAIVPKSLVTSPTVFFNSSQVSFNILMTLICVGAVSILIYCFINVFGLAINLTFKHAIFLRSEWCKVVTVLISSGTIGLATILLIRVLNPTSLLWGYWAVSITWLCVCFLELNNSGYLLREGETFRASVQRIIQYDIFWLIFLNVILFLLLNLDWFEVYGPKESFSVSGFVILGLNSFVTSFPNEWQQFALSGESFIISLGIMCWVLYLVWWSSKRFVAKYILDNRMYEYVMFGLIFLSIIMFAGVVSLHNSNAIEKAYWSLYLFGTGLITNMIFWYRKIR